MDLLKQLTTLLGNTIAFGGGIWLVFAGIQLGTALKDHQGPAIGSALWSVAGAGCILGSGLLLTNLTF